ncbi:MAG: hypothetical protein ACOC38_10960 [Promethearchaeia archaeon]
MRIYKGRQPKTEKCSDKKRDGKSQQAEERTVRVVGPHKAERVRDFNRVEEVEATLGSRVHGQVEEDEPKAGAEACVVDVKCCGGVGDDQDAEEGMECGCKIVAVAEVVEKQGEWAFGIDSNRTENQEHGFF